MVQYKVHEASPLARIVAIGRPAESRHAGPGPIAPATWFGRLAANLAASWAEHQTATALGRLDDRLLRDIGLARSEIPAVARAMALKSKPVVPPIDWLAPWRALKAYRAKRRTIAELRALDPRILRDIGVEPGQIETVVERGYARV